jgi:hypothetical protein
MKLSENKKNIVRMRCISKGSITPAFWMCSLDVRFAVACMFNVIFGVKN